MKWCLPFPIFNGLFALFLGRAIFRGLKRVRDKEKPHA